MSLKLFDLQPIKHLEKKDDICHDQGIQQEEPINI